MAVSSPKEGFWLLLSLLGLDRQIQAICDIKSRILLKNLSLGRRICQSG